jgi:hypothetical protein
VLLIVMQIYVRLRSPKSLPTEMALPGDHHRKVSEAAE